MTPEQVRERWPALTDRQAAVVTLYERGMSERAIAAALGVSRGTVRDHLAAAERHIAAAEAAGRTQEASPA